MTQKWSSNIFGYWLSIFIGNISVTKRSRTKNVNVCGFCGSSRELANILDMQQPVCVNSVLWTKRLLEAFCWQNSQQPNLSIYLVSQNILMCVVYVVHVGN